VGECSAALICPEANVLVLLRVEMNDSMFSRLTLAQFEQEHQRKPLSVEPDLGNRLGQMSVSNAEIGTDTRLTWRPRWPWQRSAFRA
jgi:hypothetical protein